jgi:hypothetical protein
MVYALAAIAVTLLCALLVIQAYRIVVGYRKATGTPWQRFLAAFSHSHTIFVARLGAFVAAGLAFLQSWLPTLDPATPVGAAVTSILKPEYTPYYLLGFSLLVEYMRRRAGSVDPILPPPQAVVIPPSPVLVPAAPAAPTPPAA